MGPAEAPVETFFAYWGYDSEYELTVELFRQRIVWLLELDVQWSDPPKRIEQSLDEYLRDGPPRECAWGANPSILASIDAQVRRVRQPGVASAKAQ